MQDGIAPSKSCRSKGGAIAPGRTRFYDVSHLGHWREMLLRPSNPSNAGKNDMAAESKIESRNQRDRLTETELDGVVAASAAANTTQLLSNCMRMIADTQKAIIGNIR
jgi:hypothetical protein